MSTIQDIIELRHNLHQHPEISNREKQTSARISEFVQRYHPDKTIDISHTGKAFVFEGKNPGPTVMFRAELDALPILEHTDVPYSSQNSGVSHACGHDGHMSMVAGLAPFIAENRPEKGRVVLLFQPAEEVEQGARDVVESAAFTDIAPDFIFGLHNIPGIPKGEIVLRKGTFSAASKGMIIRLTGKTSHAAEPENGISPVRAIEQIIHGLSEVAENKSAFNDLALLTIVHIRMGEVTFGTTPGDAEVMVTLRAYENNDMQKMTRLAEQVVEKAAESERLQHVISYVEDFPALENDDQCVDMLEDAVRKTGLAFGYREQPFKWSEDFSYYTQKYKGGFFGLGSGTDQPQLHNPEFNFPDDILGAGMNIFQALYKMLLT
ncbi:peptidase M20 [Prolixibacter bellariivorans]|uniref:Peptidase M20 n=1 Tax=Prolixibacter bellariivorans TaxID=314319 RepID=A0A5M4B3I0_9BACT|nr:amidohydrolase [Prolixibacter bellariivorans]GET34426.1 peptidase M20 [Prolixibacter bellariivorans]